ncbi:hypothetical protein [Paenibacillus radicis (ex Gao et al. 2016)]|uniref:Uncharacterized protein n=1 Tax=Paenibacillus radicis (ex Gao et al. 2016) TaxID=1737354 RepID=A0A917GNU5_9BACL|nr:hypothetical protein [Paenibacillus radicis (ex Gao et al. 2016)]GGG52946.1 hypothetical protein GCM10010918_01990 [Paenibacillus radicis (ex Gao et al. 2016)]
MQVSLGDSQDQKMIKKKALVKVNEGVYNDHKMKAVYMLAVTANMEPIPDILQ